MENLPRISEAASLALHAMTYLAANPGTRISAKEIAEALGVSCAHLHKVLQRLTKVGFVSSVPGPRGGFALEEGRENLSLLDIYETVEGRLVPNRCLLGRPICGGTRCIFGGILEKVAKEARDYLAGTRLSDVKHLFEGSYP